MKRNGLRRVSAASIAAQRASRAYPEVDRISRVQALQTAKRAAVVLGLKAAKIALIDQLFGFSQSQDWKGQSRPIVWPSNKLLARRLGVTISTLKHHLHGLVQAGLIAYADGPTFQRRGRRDAAGDIVEGHGIDLSPIVVRHSEFAELAAAAERDAQDRQKLSYARTVLRREAQAIVTDALERGLEGPWAQMRAQLDRIRETRATSREILEDQVDRYRTLRDAAEDAYDDAIQGIELQTAISKFRPIPTTADDQNSVESITRRAPEGAQHAFAVTCGDIPSIDDKNGRGRPDLQGRQQTQHRDISDDIVNISLPLVREACPQAVDFVPAAFKSWTAFRANAETMCRITNINPQVLEEARVHLGPDLAAVAVALTLQRSATGTIAKPGAYLRALVQRGRAGELHLSRSLFALHGLRRPSEAKL